MGTDPAFLLLPPSLLHLSIGTPSSTRLMPEAGRLPRFEPQPLPLPLQPRSGTRLTLTTAPAEPHEFWELPAAGAVYPPAHSKPTKAGTPERAEIPGEPAYTPQN
ncbi:unnamed protein product [Rangifer tarandus platyrhynchus]|uniref:Uncharacterized protein n=1 Tax=Rangifer tarandus platyrhynchus TaxID=3082113 RepID=A0AC59ZSC5_RANTA